jgi:hypothetical protein
VNKITLILIAGVIVASIIGYTTNANPLMEKPWEGMSCDEMKKLAVSPSHYNFTDAQHIEFHKVLASCYESQTNP